MTIQPNMKLSRPSPAQLVDSVDVDRVADDDNDHQSRRDEHNDSTMLVKGPVNDPQDEERHRRGEKTDGLSKVPQSNHMGIDDKNTKSSCLQNVKKSREKISKFLESIGFSIATTVATLYALFFNDISILAFSKEADFVVGYVNFCVFLFFSLELLLSCYAKEKYIGRFYFWLDVVSTLSLLLDVPFFMDAVLGTSASSANSNPILQQTVIARASRAARIGTRAGRIVRLFRIVRMLKMLKVVAKQRDEKLAEKRKRTAKVHVEEVHDVPVVQEIEHSPLNANQAEDHANIYQRRKTERKDVLSASINLLENELKENRSERDREDTPSDVTNEEEEPSNIYRRITELTSRKVVVGVLIMMFVLPQLDFDTSLLIPDASRGTPVLGLDSLSSVISSGCTFLPPSERPSCLSTTQAPTVCLPIQSMQKSFEAGFQYMKESVESILRSMMKASLTTLLMTPKITLLNVTSTNYSIPNDMLASAGQDIEVTVGSKETISWIPEDAMNTLSSLYAMHEPSLCLSTTTVSNTANSIYRRDSEILVYSTDDGTFSAIYSEKKDAMVKAALGIAQTLFVTILLTLGGVTFSKDVYRLVVRPIERMVGIVKNLSMNPLTALGGKTDRRQAAAGAALETDMVEGALLRIGRLLQVGFGEAGAAVIAKNIHGKDGKVNPVVPGERITAIFGFCDIRRFTDATESLQEEVMLFVNAIAHIVHSAVTRNGGFPNKNIGDAFLVAWKQTKEGGKVFLPGDGALRAFLETIHEICQSRFLRDVADRPIMKKNLGHDYSITLGFGLHLGWAIEGAIGSTMKIDASYLSPHVNISSRLEAATKQYGVMMLLSGEVIYHIKTDLLARCRKIDRITVKGSRSPIEIWTYDVKDPFVQPKEGFHEYDGIFDSPSPEYIDFSNTFQRGVDAYIKGDWQAAISYLAECHEAWPTDEPCKVLLNYMHDNLDTQGAWPGYRELTEK